jgi:23S rRNA (cytosine1962-C5)-methyltransferase
MKTRRYQVKKEVETIIKQGHPWIFKSHLSSAATIFETGDCLQLVSGGNEILGYGLFEKDSLIAIRMIKLGKTPPDASWFKSKLQKCVMKRKNIKNYTEGYRLIHGENDGFPGVVFDVYQKIGVLQTYVTSVDFLGRYLATVLRQELALETVLWKAPARRKKGGVTRVLYGKEPKLQKIREGKMKVAVDVGEGQKSGTFLDLRGLRKFLAQQNLKGKKVLNLFCYTGTLGLAAEVAGATQIWNVDISKGALKFSEEHHSLDKKKYRYIAADVFSWVESLSPHEKFDVIIVDPPSMASEAKQVPVALKAYSRVYKRVLPHLKPGGMLIVCCCTSRISRKQFVEVAKKSVGQGLGKMKSIAPEEDHPVGFPQGDYLKMLVFTQG